MLIKCSECEREVSDQAAACPHCGAPMKAAPSPPPPVPVPTKQGTGCGTYIVVSVLVLLAIGYCSRVVNNTDINPANRPGSPEPAASSEPVLEVQSFICTELADHAMIEGKVRSLAAENLSFIQAAGSFYTKDDQLIGTDTGYLEFTELLPGQESAFKVMGPRNDRYSKCTLDGFKDRRGRSLAFKIK